MMTRVETLKQKVDALYNAPQEDVDPVWKPYLFNHHIYPVAEKAGDLARRFGANEELAMAAGMLHDVADAVMRREDLRHGEESEAIAKQLLSESGFSSDDIQLVVEDAMRFHSCRNGEHPSSIEGKVMASADAVIHLTTDFYDFALKAFTERRESNEHIKKWGLEKVDRDFNKKIFFPEVKEEVRAEYEQLIKRFEGL